jgi:hypothetical protein
MGLPSTHPTHPRLKEHFVIRLIFVGVPYNFMKKHLPGAVALTLFVFVGTTALRATETENQVLRILPAPGRVVVDGKIDDWDLSGGIFTCGDVERLREQYGVWFHAMYNTDNVYLLARWLDPTPLNNGESSKGGQGFQGDCLQVRFITGYKTPQEVITWLTCWRDRDGISVVDRATPHGTGRGGVELPDLPNALGHGAQQAFRINADRKGYVQELAIPWKLLCKDGKMPAIGSELRVTVEPNFTAGAFGRLTIKDLFRVGAVPNRIFTFYSYDIWGAGILEKTGRVALAPLRLADGRELPVRLVGGLPVVDWSRLAKVRELPGFKTLAFEMPFDGHVSLNLRNKDGVVVRQLLTDHPYVKGSHTVKWDGLPTPHYRTPGEPLPAGEYTWEAIAHPGLTLTLRGWAAAAGIPWAAGPGTDWGGDHGVPSACATDGEKVYLGWNGAEGGKSVLACDADGKLLWASAKASVVRPSILPSMVELSTVWAGTASPAVSFFASALRMASSTTGYRGAAPRSPCPIFGPIVPTRVKCPTAPMAWTSSTACSISPSARPTSVRTTSPT